MICEYHQRLYGFLGGDEDSHYAHTYWSLHLHARHLKSLNLSEVYEGKNPHGSRIHGDVFVVTEKIPHLIAVLETVGMDINVRYQVYGGDGTQPLEVSAVDDEALRIENMDAPTDSQVCLPRDRITQLCCGLLAAYRVLTEKVAAADADELGYYHAWQDVPVNTRHLPFLESFEHTQR